MKKILVLALIGAALFSLAGCNRGGGSADNGVVNVYNWGEYIDESLLDEFTAETGIRVNYVPFDTNESLYAKMKSGGGYDVIIPSDYMISRMIEEDMLEPLNFDNIPNFSDINPTLKDPEYDPTNAYSVPYMWGTVGIIYNTSMVDREVTSWDILFDPDYTGQILMFDNSRDAIGIALKYLGYSYNTENTAEISEAVDLLREQKPLVQAYVMDQIFDKMEGGEAAIAPYYAGDFITMSEINPDLAFCHPSEGTNLFVDAMCIPKGSANKENAEAFINFMCSTEAGLRNCEEIGYSTPLLSVLDELDPEVAEDAVSYPEDSFLADYTETFKNLPEEILSFYDSEWTRLKS